MSSTMVLEFKLMRIPRNMEDMACKGGTKIDLIKGLLLLILICNFISDHIA